MKEHFYQKTWFKNTILILIPSAISVIGVIISIVTSLIAKIIFIFATIILMIILIVFVIYFSNFEEKIFQELQEAKDKNFSLTTILAHMENNYKTVTSEVSAFSDMIEKWAGTINSFANNIKENGYVSDKAWNKIKIIDAICVSTKNIIQQYCNDFNNANISVSYVSYIKDKNDEEWIHMVSHSSGMSFRPNACKCEVKLSDCIYHYADLIRCRLSDFEIAMNNEEILRIFKKVSITSDLSKYTQYIAIPLYCKSGKLLGIFQIVTKYGYIIETDRDKMRTFITDAIIPFSNMIILADKIYKGLYINPIQINKEV
jgi:hypothetical protein